MKGALLLRYENFYPYANQNPQFDYPLPPHPFNQPFNQPLPSPVAKFTPYIETANQFMHTAQQYAPLIGQLAPMARTLPALWKLYKGFQSIPPSTTAGRNPLDERNHRPPERTNYETRSVPNRPSNESIPKIFQPHH